MSERTSDEASDVDTSIAHAPLPTAETVRARTSLPTQALRFAVINTRMIRVILKGHQEGNHLLRR